MKYYEDHNNLWTQQSNRYSATVELSDNCNICISYAASCG